MGLGPPVCVKCMTVLSYDKERLGKGTSPWFCMVHGSCEDIQTSHVFLYTKEQANKIYEKTDKRRFKKPIKE